MKLLKNKFKWLFTKQVIQRIVFTIFILSVFQIGTFLTLPGVSVTGTEVNSVKAMLNLISGGGLMSFGILALGVSPYITSSIIIQLFSKGIVPYYTNLAEQGHAGRIKLNQHTRLFTLIFGSLYGLSIIFNPEFSLFLGITVDGGIKERLMLVFLLAVGSVFSAYLGEQIDEYGIGQGQSLIISLGILTQLPREIKYAINVSDLYIANMKPYIISVSVISIVYLLIGIISWKANKKEYKFQLQNKTHNIEVKAHYFPIKLLASSVMPVIFATSIFTLSTAIGEYFNIAWLTNMASNTYTIPITPLGLGIYIFLIFFFSYLYNIIQVDGKEIEKNLKESSMYLINVPNNETSKFITRKVLKITNFGAPILAIIATVAIGSTLLVPVNLGLTFTGVNLLIVIGVIQEITHQIKGLTDKNNYTEIFEVER